MTPALSHWPQVCASITERHLAFPIEQVWAAITEPERLGDWCPPMAAKITATPFGIPALPRLHQTGDPADGREARYLVDGPPLIRLLQWRGQRAVTFGAPDA